MNMALVACAIFLAGCGGSIKDGKTAGIFIPDPYERLAEKIAGGHKYLANRKVAVLPFSYTDKHLSHDGAVISERLLTAITNKREFEVIERSLLEKVLAELNLQRSGIMDENSIKGLGKILGVEGIVTGTLTRRKDGRIEINARLIKTESAAVIIAAVASVTPDWETAGAAVPEARKKLTLPAPPPAAEKPVSPPEQGRCSRDVAAYWKLDENIGMTAHDSLNDNNGRLLNGPFWTKGKVGNALSFDGIDDYIDFPASNSLNSPSDTGKLSIEGWYYLRDVASLRGDCVNAPAKYERASPSYGLFICNSPWMKVRFHLGDEYVDYNVPHELNTWIHYAVTYDGAVAKIFKNGTEVQNKTGTFNIISNNSDVIIGRHGATPVRFFNGLIDEVAIYNRALSSAEVAGHYASGLAGKGYCIP